MTFADFDGLYCRLTQANIGMIFGYSTAYLTLWKTSWYLGQVAYIKGMDGWGLLLPGASVGHGMTILSRGSGAPAAKIDFPLILVPDDDDGDLPEPLASVKVEAREGPLIRLPGDYLFDFDSARLRDEATPLLIYLSDMLNNRRTLPVVIEGHTDSVGARAYNLDLSARRAKAVKRWLVAHRVHGAGHFTVRAFGESRPVAANRSPDGSDDDPEGRRLNRRVVVRADWNFVR